VEPLEAKAGGPALSAQAGGLWKDDETGTRRLSGGIRSRGYLRSGL